MRMVPDFKKADIEGLKRYLRVTDWQRAGKKGQPRFRTDVREIWLCVEGEVRRNDMRR